MIMITMVINFLAKDSNFQFIGINKAKSQNKKPIKRFRYFLESNFIGVERLYVLVYSDKDGNAKIFNARKFYLPKGIIKNYNVINNGKKNYDQSIDSDIKRYEEIKNNKRTM